MGILRLVHYLLHVGRRAGGVKGGARCAFIPVFTSHMLRAKHRGRPMFTVEMLNIDWDDRDNPQVVQRIPLQVPRLGEATMIARWILDNIKSPPPNAYRIKDEGGKIVLHSWGKDVLARCSPD